MRALRLLMTGLMALTALGCAAWGLAAQGGRWSVRLDVLTHFAPILLGLAVIPGIYGLVCERGRARGLLAALSAVALVAFGTLIAPEYLRPEGPPAGRPHMPGQIKLIQFNAWEGNTRLGETVSWLRAQDPDILVVEEASVIAPMLKRAFAGYHVSCGDCSVIILSKARPVARDVPVPPAADDIRPPIAGATFRDAHGEFSVFGTHYTWPIYGGWQQAQGRVIADLLNRFPKDRLILTGDFNSTPWSFSRRREDAMFGLERRTRALFSWPVQRGRAVLPFALLPIDHVYAGPGWRTVGVERGPRLGSDHYPVIVTLAPSP